MNRPIIVLFALLALLAGPARAGEVRIAVAANFTATMNELVPLFEKESGHRALVSFGSSGKLYTQIVNGAPFEIFLSADNERPAQLEAQGLALAGSRFTYATGRLALWSSDVGRVDAKGEVLRGGGYSRLAIANPKTAPYGAAAMEVLQGLGLQTQISPRLVQGDSIAQAWQFVATGNAQLGLVAYAQVVAADSGSYWLVPQTLYTPLRQEAVLLKRGATNDAAATFLAFLRSERARAIIERSGYGVE